MVPLPLTPFKIMVGSFQLDSRLVAFKKIINIIIIIIIIIKLYFTLVLKTINISYKA